MFFTETWFNDLSDTCITGYHLHRTDRDSRAGGVAIYVQNEIVSFDINLPQLNSTCIEQKWTKIRFGDESFLLGCIYRPHDYDDLYLTNTIQSITSARNALVSLNCSAMLLYGDFNFSHTWYEAVDIGGGVATVGHVIDERPGDIRFQTCLEECHLAQLVTFPTYRQARNVAPKSTLDLIISDDPDRLIELSEAEPLGHTPEGQAHCMITGLMAVAGKSSSSSPTKPRYIWSRADFTKINSHIAAIDWLTLFDKRSVNDCYNLLVEKYNEAVKLHIPTTTAPFKTKNELWVTPEVLEAVENKRQLWARYISSGRHTHELLRDEHKAASKNVARVVKKAMLEFEEALAYASKSDRDKINGC